jgi:hypothetical protein
MKTAAFLFCALTCTAAAAAPASRESVDHLIALGNSERVIELVRAQQRKMIDSMVDRMAQQKKLTPEQAERAHAAARKTFDAVGEELAWDKLEPLMAQVYMETFSEEEIQGLIAFYESPTGRAFVEKMPQATQRAMQLIQARVGPAIERAQAAVRDQMGNSATPAAVPGATPATPSTPPRGPSAQ